MKIKMHAMYDHFPEYNPKEGEPYIDIYSDSHIFECKEEGKNVALLLEPRSMINGSYEYVEQHHDLFRYIFTHDSKLLKLPNARELNWGDVWLTTDSEKTKGISLVTSYKDWCPLHKARLDLAKQFFVGDKVDVFFGDWNNPRIRNVRPEEYLEHYKFSIVIENDLDDFWYTEKILNCFSTKTVPIYLGAKVVDQRFNPKGIIRVDDWRKIPEVVKNLDPGSYENMRNAIEDNFKRVEPYKVSWKERFFRDYGELLEGMNE